MSDPVIGGDSAQPGPPDSTQAAADGKARGAWGQVEAERFSFAEAIGGPRGAAESLAPPLLFILGYTLTHDLRLSLILAVGSAAVALVLRVLTRSSPMQAISGAIGVAICAVVASRTGQARDFYLPGFAINAGYGLVFLLSLIPLPVLRLGGVNQPRGAYPVIGLLVGAVSGEGLTWRRDPRRRRMFTLVTALWVGFYALRLLVQGPLYLADQVEALGVARLMMGVPLFALMIWLSWMIVRSVPKAAPIPDPPAPNI